MTFTYHIDAGHGWLEVPACIVDYLGVHPTKYSYVSDDNSRYYLEEDIDMGMFLRELKSKNTPYSIKTVEDGDYSPIRRLRRIELKLAYQTNEVEDRA